MRYCVALVPMAVASWLESPCSPEGTQGECDLVHETCDYDFLKLALYENITP